MTAGVIAKRYAQALYKLATAQEVVEDVRRDMQQLARLLRQVELKDLMQTPVIPTARKKAFFKQVFGEAFHPLTLRFVEFVMDKKREALLGEMCVAFEESYRAYHNIVPARIVTAVELDAPMREKLQQALKGIFPEGELEMDAVVDPSIIGGFVLQVSDKLYDASVSGTLERMRQKL